VAEGFRIAPDDPCLDGHFPGRPLVPGVVLLDAVLSRIGPAGDLMVESVKFLRPVLPGQEVAITLSGTGRVAVSAAVDGTPVLTGFVRTGAGTTGAGRTGAGRTGADG